MCIFFLTAKRYIRKSPDGAAMEENQCDSCMENVWFIWQLCRPLYRRCRNVSLCNTYRYSSESGLMIPRGTWYPVTGSPGRNYGSLVRSLRSLKPLGPISFTQIRLIFIGVRITNYIDISLWGVSMVIFVRTVAEFMTWMNSNMYTLWGMQLFIHAQITTVIHIGHGRMIISHR